MESENDGMGERITYLVVFEDAFEYIPVSVFHGALAVTLITFPVTFVIAYVVSVAFRRCGEHRHSAMAMPTGSF